MPEAVGVALLGRGAERSRHLAAIAAVRGLRLLDGCDEEQPERLLADRRVEVVCVLASLAERGYWVRQALDAGHTVMCAAPPATSRDEGGAVLNACTAHPERLQIEAPSLHSGFADETRQAASGVPSVVYARLRIVVPRDWLGPRSGGLLGVHALWAPWLLEALFGAIDTIAAHTRALVRNRPEEDFALAHLEFVSGVEAALEVHALGLREAFAELEIHGQDGEQVSLRDDLRRARVVGLRQQYEHLVGAVRGEPTASAFVPDLDRALHLTDWLRRSARHGRRLREREPS